MYNLPNGRFTWKGHGTTITIPQDKFFVENECIRTVRLNTNYIWPKKRMPDEVILEELKLLPVIEFPQ